MRALHQVFLGCCLGALCLWTLATSAVAEDKHTGGSCSLRYGWLMTDQWLVVDLAQQIERGLDYCPGAESVRLRADFDKLQHSVTAAGRELDNARSLYKAWFATNSADSLIRLSSLLDRTAVAESNNTQSAAALLQKLGEQCVR